mgnify:CR=1 FL=1
MIILIPMGGHGSRFSNAGYKINKASIPTTNRRTLQKEPMVVCAMEDIPGIRNPTNKIVCVNRDFHATDGTEEVIKRYFAKSIFIHDHVLLDQAFGCFLAREYLQSSEDLFIGACDNGMEYDEKAFEKIKTHSDVVMISHSNDQNISRDPLAHSWAVIDKRTQVVKELSIKKTVSENPMVDHATTGMFWFRRADQFLKYLDEMIWNRDTLDGKYYVDKVLNYFIRDGLTVNYFDVRYICWGTPEDYENYENTLKYWKDFSDEEEWMIKRK